MRGRLTRAARASETNDGMGISQAGDRRQGKGRPKRLKRNGVSSNQRQCAATD
jgi:hypothetical protein